MSERRRFVAEIGVEEIPSQYLDPLTEAWREALQSAFQEARLAVEGLRVQSTPRRFVAEGWASARQWPFQERVKGPSVAHAYRDGQPTPALLGFCRRVGLPPESLAREGVGEKAYLVAVIDQPQASLEATLPEVVSQAFAGIPLPRSMRWDASDYRFVRPVRWALLLVDGQLLDVTVLGVSSGGVTYGNRTDAPEALPVSSVDAYFQAIDQGRVMLSATDRQHRIRETGDLLATETGGQVLWDEDLLSEVTHLVEWPTPFIGHFDSAFLAVPDVILMTSMRTHQRYFPLVDASGRLLPAFLAVRNGIGEDLALVRRGNEKVLRARLADAEYFYRTDRQKPLEAYAPGLAQMIFHQELGTYQDKVDRVRRLFQGLAAVFRGQGVAETEFERAVRLYKCDLLTHVVQEFPELQGVMGGLYAELDGESPAVAAAIRDQYRPQSADDQLPTGALGQVLGLLDRLDTLLMAFRHNIRPTGSEDPFGLRRAALAVARLALETDVLAEWPLDEVIRQAGEILAVPPEVAHDVYRLVVLRVETYLDTRYPTVWMRAVLSRPGVVWSDLRTTLAWLAELTADPAFETVAAAYKRMRRVGEAGDPAMTLRAEALDLERQLDDQFRLIEAVDGKDRDLWWARVKASVPLIQTFFDEILVMDPDPGIRQNRLALLARGQRAYGRYFAWEELG